MRKRPPFPAVIVLGAVVALWGAACETPAPGRTAPQAEPSAPLIIRQSGGTELMQLAAGQVPGMTVAPVATVELPGVLETTGQVAFDDRHVSTIVSRVAGRIEQTRVSLWDNVRRGQPIVELYSPDFMTAEAEYLQSRSTAKVSTVPGIDNSGQLAHALIEAARRKLELLGMPDSDIDALSSPTPTVWMRAPISGTVVENKVVRGSAVNPGDVLLSLGTLNVVWITADIFEEDLARVSVGQELEAVTTAFPDQIFKGVVTRISPNIDPNTHTLQIRCEVKNPGLRLKPRMLARVRVVTRPGMALVVPQEALVFETDSYYTYVVHEGDQVERRKVTIGPWGKKGYVRVLSGLSPGERVVARESIQVDALWHQAHGETS